VNSPPHVKTLKGCLIDSLSISKVAIFNIVWDWSESAEVMKNWQEWTTFVDERLTSIVRLFTPKIGRIFAVGEFVIPVISGDTVFQYPHRV
jgi:hypothetical protein